MPLIDLKAVQFSSATRLYPAFRYLVVFGAAVLLAGCVGEPQTYYAAKPIVLQRRSVARIGKKLVPTLSAPTSIPVLSAPVLSTDEKQRLFQDFEASQGSKDPIVTAPKAEP